jgi:hypothetical protein
VRLHKIARAQGGRVLSPAYINNQAALEFECAAGHRFVSRPLRIFAGRWCARCDGYVRRSLVDCAEWARKRGGRCLATAYVHANFPLPWRCAEGHVWKARPNAIRQGGWCPRCAGRGPRVAAELQALARTHGGVCRSTSSKHRLEHLRWRCASGHEFTRTLADVRRGRWCLRCRGRMRWSLAELQRLAEARGGACMSRRYVNSQAPMRWRCAEGHTWSTSANHVVRGSWCGRCSTRTRAYRRRLTLDDMHATAAQNRGRCLSPRYCGSAVKLRWRCAAGHEWWATPAYVRSGRWCIRCDAASRTGAHLSRR